MSYNAKRIVLLLMLWGLIIFGAVQTRLAINDSKPAAASAAVVAAVTATPADRAAQLEQALVTNPNDMTSVIALAELRFGQKDYQNALQLYEQALKSDPKNADIMTRVGMCELYSLDFTSASATFQQVTTLDPSRAEAHLLYGLTLSRLNPPQLALARAEWQKAQQLAPNSDTATQAAALLQSAGQ